MPCEKSWEVAGDEGIAYYMDLMSFVLFPELTLQEKKVEYEYQVKSLEAEIRLLEDELKRRDQPLNYITDEQLEQAM